MNKKNYKCGRCAECPGDYQLLKHFIESDGTKIYIKDD